MSLAVMAAFTACTQDDELLTNGNAELNGRKIINSDLTFNFDFGGNDASTRLIIGDDIAPTVGDAIGAALIDEVSGNGTLANGYHLTTGISTNHPFTTENGTSWSTPTRLVEGNYLFYYQWNEGLGGSRNSAIPYKLSNSQYAYKQDVPTVFVAEQAVQDNNVGVGYTFLKADKGLTPKTVNVKFQNLYAYLKFNFSTSLSGVEIQQIVVKKGDNSTFDLNGTLDNAKIYAMHTGNSTEGYTWTYTDGVFKKFTADFMTLSSNSETSSEIILTLPDEAVTSSAKSVYMVIPAADYTNASSLNNEGAEFVVDVYTNKGVWSRNVELSTTFVNGTSGDTFAQMYCGTVQPVSLNIDNNFKAADKYFVTSAEQWNKVLESLPVATESNNALNIQLLNDVELSAADIAKIQSTNAKNYTVNIDGENLVLTENATLSDMTINNLTVKAGVAADLGKNLVVATLTNNGTITVDAVASPNNVAKVITALTNNGTATIKTKASIAGLTNATSGTVTVSSEAELTLGSTSTNNGTINNNGMIVANGVFTNSGLFYNNAGGVLSNVYAAGNANKVVNLGTIEAEEGSTTIVAENANVNGSKGTINYKDGASVSVTSTTYKGIIAYIVTSDYTVPTSKVEYNTIIVKGITLALSGNHSDVASYGVTNITIKEGAVLDLSDYDTTTALSLIKVEGPNNRIIGSAIVTTTLEVATGGYLLIPLNSQVTATTLTNKGTVNVGGTLVYSASGSTKGTLLGTGTITAN